MSIKQEHRRPDPVTEPIALSSQVIAVLDTGKLPERAPIVDQTQEGETRRLVRRQVVLPKIGAAFLNIDFRHYYETWEKDFDMIGLQYEGKDQLVGEMQFVLPPNGRYRLTHRYVTESLRGQGIGEALLKQAEHILQAIATRRKQTVEIEMQLGQRDVLDWFEKRGYAAMDDHSRDLIAEVKEHPEHFVIADIIPKDKHDIQNRKNGIFRLDTEGRTIDDTERINLIKTLLPTAE
jgi:GNAT superfamily N-acetyltransferase